MIRACDSKNDSATTNSNVAIQQLLLKCLGWWLPIHAAVSPQMPKLATVESHSCILPLSFPSAHDLSKPRGFHAIMAGGSIRVNIDICTCV